MISDRIIMLRKTLLLSKESFAAKLGMSSSSVYDWEHGKVEIKESSLLLIEFVYSVNPDWLRNGVGEMFLPSSEINLSDKMNNIFLWLKSLNDDEQAWINIELPKKFPEYKEWLKDRE